MATLEQIQARLEKLQAQAEAEAIVARQSSTVLETIRSLMEKHGLTAADINVHIGSKKRGRTAGSKATWKSGQSVAKYRDRKAVQPGPATDGRRDGL